MNPRLKRSFVLRPTLALALAFGVAASSPSATSAAQPQSPTYVDAHGVWRWSASDEEIALFGVNYTAPFAHAFRAHQRLGIDVKTAIDADTYHFARLGFDAYRVHVWDREISDADGNLVVNEHVQALDYLLAALQRRGIKIVLTPLQFGNAGYPEPGQPLEGFSSKYGKQGCLENRESWPLQERYLAQFMDHVNAVTGVAYKDDPDIIGFEICNEPGHFEYALTVEYINRMVQAIRATGCAKPIFYNMSHGLPVFQAYLDADVQGGTFQWYPSNLVAGHEQRGNFLPYVDRYPIPFADNPKFQTKAKMVYEFDAADIGRSYIYPAIARTYRGDGVQFATQFAYDPMFLAPFNTEYQTHYLNLAYAPSKALGMKIAGEAFRRVPLQRTYGAYPANTQFEGVRVSYADDLAELVTADRYFYSNTTTTPPPHPDQLVQIAGCGSSPIVRHPGTGAYFLDRLEPGVWRLEVMPDAVWIRDPFEKPSPKKPVARIAWRSWPMQINLADLGAQFHAAGLNRGNTISTSATGNTLTVGPGVYLLTRAGITSRHTADEKLGPIALGEFVAPPPSLDQAYVLHQPAPEITAQQDLEISATIAAPETITGADLVVYPPIDRAALEQWLQPAPRAQPGGGNAPGVGVRNPWLPLTIPMHGVSGWKYAATVPPAALRPGALSYHIVLHRGDRTTTFPSGLEGAPEDWDFYGEPWRTRVVAGNEPIPLFEPSSDLPRITAPARFETFDLVPSDRAGLTAMEVVARDLTEAPHDLSFRFFFKDKVAGRARDLGAMRTLRIHARAAGDAACPVQLALITADGVAYGGIVTVAPGFASASLPLESLRPVPSPNIPYGYPRFIEYWSNVAAHAPLDVQSAESILVSIGPSIPEAEFANAHGVVIERIWLE